jgi:hypothetical protein
MPDVQSQKEVAQRNGKLPGGSARVEKLPEISTIHGAKTF